MSTTKGDPSERFRRLQRLWEQALRLEPAQPDACWPELIERLAEVVRAQSRGVYLAMRDGPADRLVCRFEPDGALSDADPPIELPKGEAIRSGLHAEVLDDYPLLVGRCDVEQGVAVYFRFQRSETEPGFEEEDAEDLAAALDGLWRACRWMVLSHGLLPHGERLSKREREVLTGLLRGAGERELSEVLGLTEASLHQIVVAVYRKMNVTSRPELVARWLA